MSQKMLEVYIQHREDGEVDLYLLAGEWVPIERVHDALRAVGLEPGTMWNQPGIDEIPADVKAELLGKLQKEFPGKKVVWGLPKDEVN